MTDPADVLAVETEDDYVHVRFRDPDEFERIRTPDWAQEVAESVSAGAEVRTGKETDEDDWEVQSVLVEDRVDEPTAEEQAREIVEKIRS